MNCYEAMKKMYEIDDKMQSIGNLLCKAKNEKEILTYEKMIDVLESEFLELKHSLEQTALNSSVYNGR